jgi:iron complex transport system substrate-binding protein
LIERKSDAPSFCILVRDRGVGDVQRRVVGDRPAACGLDECLQRWVSGRDSLVSSLLTETGLLNPAVDLGVAFGGFASLEAIVSLRPDFILVSESGDRAEDDGRAFLLHPALQRFYPPEKRIVIPERLTVCGGVMLAEALDVLTAELKRVAR